jgi:hypothetical protein
MLCPSLARKIHVRLLALLAAMLVPCMDGVAAEQHSVAREWNEALIGSIKSDKARPPVHARNFFHLSAAMWDAWAAYDPEATGWLFTEKHTAEDVEAARRQAVSHAAYRLLRQRFLLSVGATTIQAKLSALMTSLGYDPNYTGKTGDSPADVGNRIAAQYITFGRADGSNELNNYQGDFFYTSVHSSNIQVIYEPGNPWIQFIDRWQPLKLKEMRDQNGNPVPGNFQIFESPHWGLVTPFALQPEDKTPGKTGVYIDPGAPPTFNGADGAVRANMHQVLARSGMMDPDDGVMWDIGPGARGNNPLGTNSGTGYALNPFTGQPYAANPVLRGDYLRVLAEFWADGPNSETPPGHWNTIANKVTDDPNFVRRFAGIGPELDALEFDVRMYLCLNGALHDAAINAWGVKSYYDTSRPVSVIRYQAMKGQRTDPSLPRYDPDGLDLEPGLVEMITSATTAPGQRHEALAGSEGKIAVRTWRGAPTNPATDKGGVGWILGEWWVPYQRPTFVTPPFAGYVSGHSTYSRTGAEVLARVTGSEFFPGGMGIWQMNPGYLVFEYGPSQPMQLQWATYFDAADESALSRIAGGIHPSHDDLPGRRLGAVLGPKAYAFAKQFFGDRRNYDVDGDGGVGSSDLALVLLEFGSVPFGGVDFNGDALVDAADVAEVLLAWSN